jgi:hypothetical protein
MVLTASYGSAADLISFQWEILPMQELYQEYRGICYVPGNTPTRAFGMVFDGDLHCPIRDGRCETRRQVPQEIQGFEYC